MCNVPRRALISFGAVIAHALFAGGTGSAQTTRALEGATLPRFEVASIRPSPPIPAGAVGLRITHDEARFTWIPLRSYIANAFGVPDDRIDGPAWLASAHFDLVAKMPEDPAQNDLQHVPAMLQALLQERFHLRTHLERREFTVFGLEVSPKGPALTRAPEDSPAPGPFSVLSGPSGGRKVTTFSDGASLALGDNGLEARRMSMSGLAAALTPFAGRPVVDMTNLDGRFDVKFTLEPEDFVALMRRSVAAAGFAVPQEDAQRVETASTVALPEALEKAGLLLRTRRASLDVLIVDAVDRNPTDN